MSLAAFIWASNLPLEVVHATAYRALLKYADRADEHGRAAWFTAAGLAESLGCSLRTAQRAVLALTDAGLLIEGDQRFVKHISANRRPTVYDLAMRPTAPARLPLDDTSQVDASRADVSEGVSYVTPRRPATSPGVAHRTVSEPNKNLGSNQGRSSYVTNDVSRVPRIPAFDPASVPPRPEAVSAEQATLNEQARSYASCTGSRPHLIPATATGCIRCGVESSTITTQK